MDRVAGGSASGRGVRSPSSPTFQQSTSGRGTGRGRGFGGDSLFNGQSEFSPEETSGRYKTIQYDNQGLDSAPSRTPEPVTRHKKV